MHQNSAILIIAAAAPGAKLGRALALAGYEVVQVGSAYRGLALANEQGAALAVVSHTLPDIPGIEVANQLEQVCPVILICTPLQAEWLGVLGRHIMLLTTPVKARPFVDAVELSLRSRPTRPPAARPKPDRQIIAQAKQRLMDFHRIDEPSAHRQLQRLSMNSGKPLAEVAKIVLGLLED